MPIKKVECLSSKQEYITKQDNAQVIYELRHEFPVKSLGKLAGFPCSTYYELLKQRNLKRFMRSIWIVIAIVGFVMNLANRG